jgi:hypothetical protein
MISMLGGLSKHIYTAHTVRSLTTRFSSCPHRCTQSASHSPRRPTFFCPVHSFPLPLAPPTPTARANMAAIKLLNLVAVISLALFASSFNAPVNALAAGHQHSHLNRQIAHEGVARRSTKRSSKRCKPKSSSASQSPAPTSATSTPSAIVSIQISSQAPAPEKTDKPSPSPSPSPKPSPSPSPKPAPAPAPAPAPPASSGGNSGKVLGIAWNGGNAPSLGLLANGNADTYVSLIYFPIHSELTLLFIGCMTGASGRLPTLMV